MKLIDEYLDTLYKKDNNKRTLELKQEMREYVSYLWVAWNRLV